MASEQSFVPTSVNVEIEGDITVPGAPEEDEGPSTLDEPVSETLVSCIYAQVCFLEVVLLRFCNLQFKKNLFHWL